MNTSVLSTALRTVPKKLTAPASPVEPVASPSVTGPAIEFIREDGRVSTIYVRSNKKVTTLSVTRDDEGQILNLKIIKRS